ncbi:hypothetical protein MtrunA17_Chr4g0026461 [Medicago truncatula]|uniref:Uncharacterized protein n=1 Tax=Medicago truncatula TaxID=3880 RepID=A0A396ICD7_MEDTR|nr:hypothetical protein MtrunA17_Chr4g0026461 [Medicago truncatula]
MSRVGMSITERLEHCASDLSLWNKTTRNGMKGKIAEYRKELNR